LGGSRSRGLVGHRLEHVGLDVFLEHVPEVGTLLLVQVGGAVPVVLMDQDDLEAEGLPEVALEAVLLVKSLDPKDVFFVARRGWRIVPEGAGDV